LPGNLKVNTIQVKNAVAGRRGDPAEALIPVFAIPAKRNFTMKDGLPRFYGWINLVGLMRVYGSLCGNITYAYGIFLPAMGGIV
jgi:hypothetical protein